GECVCPAQAQGLAYGEYADGTVQRVAVELGDALIDQAKNALRGHSGSAQMACLLIFVEPFEAAPNPVRDTRTRFRGEPGYLLEILDWNETGHDRQGDAARLHPVEKTEIDFVVEEELGDGGGGAGIDLGLQHIDVRLDARRFRMLLRIA